MTDPEPPSRKSPGHRRGLFGLFDVFRRTAEHAANEAPEPLSEAGGELVNQARAFQDLRVEDVMKPRADVVAVERGCTFAEVVARFAEAEHSRMPVYKETLDEPVGVVHVKDVFKLLARKTRQPKPDDRILTGRHHLVREVLYVPPSMAAARLLATMRAKRIHMALVMDEFGGVDGLVTLEDLLETLVGEIADEHDEEIETVAGLVNALAGRVPQRRERIDHPDGFTLEVLAADPRRVKRVRVRRVPVAETSAEA